MARNSTKNYQEYEEVAHYAISEFLVHPRRFELIEKKQALKFILGIIHRSYHSSTSPYHKLYRQRGKMNSMENYVFEAPTEDYDYERDLVVSQINKIIERCCDIRTYNVDAKLWYNATLFKTYLEYENFSEISRLTGIPRTSISSAVTEFKTYVQQELIKAGITWHI